LSSVYEPYVTCGLDDSATNGLLKCKHGLNVEVINYARKLIDEGKTKKVVDYFEKNIIKSKYLKTDRETVSKLVSALLDIIKEDPVDGEEIIEMVSNTTKKALLSQSNFVLSNFLAGLFLYSVLAVKNNLGKDFVNDINEIYLNTFNGKSLSVNITRPNTEIQRDLSTKEYFSYNDIQIAKHIISSMEQEDIKFIIKDNTFVNRDKNHIGIKKISTFVEWLFDSINLANDNNLEMYRNSLGCELVNFSRLLLKFYDGEFVEISLDDNLNINPEDDLDEFLELTVCFQSIKETYDTLIRYCKEKLPNEEIENIWSGIYSEQDIFNRYLKGLQNRYSKVKTLVNDITPIPFYDFYVCSNIKQTGTQANLIKETNIAGISKVSNNVIITGTGGLGKSMLMNHLLV
jgi:hypothetical protein